MEQSTDSSGLQNARGKVCNVQKSFYGMTEAGNIWGNLPHSKFISWGIKQSGVDKRMYILRTANGFAIILAEVDYMATAAYSFQLMERIKRLLTRTF